MLMIYLTYTKNKYKEAYDLRKKWVNTLSSFCHMVLDETWRRDLAARFGRRECNMKLKRISGISEGLLNEAGLSRLLAHAAGPFVILTAFRGNFSLKQNRDRNKQLEQKFREIDAGGIKLIGYYQEEGAATPSREESYFVPMPSGMLLTDFMGWAQSVIQEFDQESAVFARDASHAGAYGAPSDHFDDFEDEYELRSKPKVTQDPSHEGENLPQKDFIYPGVWLLWKAHGEPMTHIGNKITVDRIAQAYSIMKGKTFIFEGTMHPGCNAHRMGLDLRGVKW